MKKPVIDEVYKEALTVVYSYAPHINDWMMLKKALLLELRSEYRTKFSTRDPKTHAQTINPFESEIMKIWSDMTGRPVIFKNDVKKKKSTTRNPKRVRQRNDSF